MAVVNMWFSNLHTSTCFCNTGTDVRRQGTPPEPLELAQPWNTPTGVQTQQPPIIIDQRVSEGTSVAHSSDNREVTA